MRDYQKETEDRAAFIRRKLAEAHASGVVFGNSGGKDSALVGILCKKACEKVISVAMPCASSRNYGEDLRDAAALAEQYGFELRTVDLTAARAALMEAVGRELTPAAVANLAPRLRMTTLYGIAQTEGCLVAGTGNRSERYMGYFTKWGDGACDFNPIADLTVAEVYEYLRFLGAPPHIIEKTPSAGLYEGQTDEAEMGVAYADIDGYLGGLPVDEHARAVIERAHHVTEHKRHLPEEYQPD
ncbi:MAG TPA: NAD(+) synthase [Oscillospiraceae bacterium]|nr:NAD(+) synthase [Oscillospiraceae bacterium]HNW04315.1 NAD(+) synthase [Oscillospiraceae bacterium]